MITKETIKEHISTVPGEYVSQPKSGKTQIKEKEKSKLNKNH